MSRPRPVLSTVEHHVGDPMKACDYAVLLKRLIKNIA
ncbi:hypothetical protein PAMH19_5443 [Pseudomonas aeruginosa]|nr:hypothetical protein PAMH19_5443 [Pseudomonas aeruginosa]